MIAFFKQPHLITESFFKNVLATPKTLIGLIVVPPLKHLPYTFFMSNQDQALVIEVACILKIFRPKSLTKLQLYSSNFFSICHWYNVYY